MSLSNSPKSLLQPVHPDDIHDLICIGFGPASLAIAIALQDALAASPPSHAHGSENRPKVAFLERQEQFFWHAGMLLPGAKMQISFIKDLATLRDPRSEFTFLNYLHRQNRLVQFCNLSTFLPLREEYQDYMKWCAGSFEDVVSYNQEVVDVLPEKLSKGSAKVDCFVVRSKDRSTGSPCVRRTRNVVIAVGGKPSIPRCLPQSNPKVIHSSQYSKALPRLLVDQGKDYTFVVIGGGQSAAEIFNDLQERYPRSRTNLVIKGSALRPSDDSPFVNEIFDPNRIDGIFRQDAQSRKAAINLDRGTNYGVVRLELLEHIYARLYTQRLRNPNELEWQHRIINETLVTDISDTPGRDTVRVNLAPTSNTLTQEKASESCIEADAVLIATGYERNAHEDMLRAVEGLQTNPAGQAKGWEVSRNYQVKLDKDLVESNAGIWLQGCNESTHGLSDTLLSVLANRGGEMVESIFGSVGQNEAHRRNGFVTPPDEQM